MQVSVWWVLAAGVPGLVALGVTLWLWRSVTHVRAGQQVLLPDGVSVPLADRQSALQQSMARIERSLDDLEDLVDRQARITEDGLRSALHFQGLVRYDGYRDMGGSQSWSVALLDGNHSGSIITSLHARDHARVYLKHVVEGVSEQRLSPEEQQAAAIALGRPLGPPPPRTERPARAARTTPTGEFCLPASDSPDAD